MFRLERSIERLGVVGCILHLWIIDENALQTRASVIAIGKMVSASLLGATEALQMISKRSSVGSDAMGQLSFATLG